MSKHDLFILLYVCRFQAVAVESTECVDVLLRSGARVDDFIDDEINWNNDEIKGKLGAAELDHVRFSSLIKN